MGLPRAVDPYPVHFHSRWVMVGIGWAGAVDPFATDLHGKDEVERLVEWPLFFAL